MANFYCILRLLLSATMSLYLSPCWVKCISAVNLYGGWLHANAKRWVGTSLHLLSELFVLTVLLFDDNQHHLL